MHMQIYACNTQVHRTIGARQFSLLCAENMIKERHVSRNSSTFSALPCGHQRSLVVDKRLIRTQGRSMNSALIPEESRRGSGKIRPSENRIIQARYGERAHRCKNGAFVVTTQACAESLGIKIYPARKM